MISIPKILNHERENGQVEIKEDEAEHRIQAIKRILPKDNEDNDCPFCNQGLCECFTSTELYSIYAKNRCYMAYEIQYKERERD